MTEVDELANIRHAIHSRLDLVGLVDRAELTDAQTAAVLAWWHRSTGGLQFSDGWVGTIGVRAYHWLRAKYGSAARGIDGAERITSEAAAAMTENLLLHMDWLDTDRAPEIGAWLTEFDVNGQFHSASSIELGTGEPDVIEKPRTLDGYLTMPGYVRLADIPYPPLQYQLSHTWRAFGGIIEPGRALAMPTVRYLVRRGVELDASQVVLWPRHRRHLDAWYTLFRTARQELATAAHHGSKAALICLALLKEVVNTTLGGWLRSDKNHSDMLRKDWSDQIITEGWVRALVAIDKCGEAGGPAVGMRRDAAWFIGADKPAGLTVDTRFHESGRNGQLGKWKLSRTVQVTQSIVDAWQTGSPEMVNRAIKKEWEIAHV